MAEHERGTREKRDDRLGAKGTRGRYYRVLHNDGGLFLPRLSAHLRDFNHIPNEQHRLGQSAAVAILRHLRRDEKTAVRIDILWSNDGDRLRYDGIHGSRHFSRTAGVSHLRPTGHIERSNHELGQINEIL